MIRARAKSNTDERGLDTLRLGYGLASWTTERSSATPNAPILIWQMEMRPEGTPANDFALTLIDTPEVNPVLLHLLETEFGLGIEAEDVAEFDEGTPNQAVLAAVGDRLATAAARVPGFQVNQRIVVGNFSYAKLPMVRDLEMAGKEIEQHTLLSAIAGDPDALSDLRDRHDVATDEQLVPVPPPDDEFLILDADSSQSRVIAAVLADADLVVEGPPGTGKSQTIANLIATLVARGRSVLFVAEKRAAIEAVSDRLHRVGLEDLMLDMHDGPANRRRTAQALGDALESVRSAIAPDTATLHHTLGERRRELDAYDHALHTPTEPWGLSPYEAIEGVLGIPEASRSEVRFRGSAVASIRSEVVERGQDSIEKFVRFGGGPLIERPSWGWGPTFAARRARETETVRHLVDWSDDAETHLADLRDHSELIAKALGLVVPDSVDAAAALASAIDSMRQTLTVFSSDLLDEDLSPLEENIKPAAGGAVGRMFAGVLSSSFRDARRRIREHLRNSTVSDRELPALIASANGAVARWRAAGGDQIPPSFPDTAAMDQAVEAASNALTALASAGDLRDQMSVPFETVNELLADLRSQRDQLIRMPDLDGLYQSLVGDGFLGVLHEVTGADRRPTDAAQTLRHAWLASILDRVVVDLPILGAFDARTHEELIEAFIQADRDHLDVTAERVRRAWAEHATVARNEDPGGSALVLAQSKRKRGHMPTRELFQQASRVLTAVKPCWVMSPLVVPQVLPRETCFDVVIFDEASQVQPADAVSSLLRGRRAVVAGDPHQLPPTTFFASSSASEEEAEDERSEDDLTADDVDRAKLEQARSAAAVGGYESILDVMGTLLPPPNGRRTLAWHYRSRDERLITFSNAQASLYDWSMTTFPGALAEDCIALERVEFRPRTGQPLSSPDQEVDRVVRLILEHAAERPDSSLGVIAFGVEHANRIEERLRDEQAIHPELADFFDEAADEPFFIKNLERVQGDERDSVLLTVGYGRTADGRVRYVFGPINNEGGERRLNVAITRARSRMTVVSSITGRDLDADRVKSVGARMLRDYLLYAESAGTDLGMHERQKPVLNPFERDVERHLTAAGLNLRPQFGASGFWIDFAAMHPERPGEPVLAIEADGASYHSSPTARDRDRLRQQHLENLGWRFHRIWSTEWFKNREREVKRATEAMRVAVAARDDESAPESPRVEVESDSLDDADATPLASSEPDRVQRPSVPRGRPISSYSQRQLRSLVCWVKSDGLLRTDDELLEAVRVDLDFRRRGKRIIEEISRAIAAEAGAETRSAARTRLL